MTQSIFDVGCWVSQRINSDASYPLSSSSSRFAASKISSPSSMRPPVAPIKLCFPGCSCFVSIIFPSSNTGKTTTVSGCFNFSKIVFVPSKSSCSHWYTSKITPYDLLDELFNRNAIDFRNFPNWRKGWDLNPQTPFEVPVFETGALPFGAPFQFIIQLSIFNTKSGHLQFAQDRLNL